jgi:hypothetical protein
MKSILESIRLDLDAISQVLPPLGVIHITDVIQRFSPELDTTQVSGLIQAEHFENKMRIDAVCSAFPYLCSQVCD